MYLNEKGKQLEIWTKKLFDDLGHRTEPREGFLEIVYAPKKHGQYTAPMFQIDVQYYSKWLGQKIVCECKNYGDRKYLNVDEIARELLAKVYISGAVKGQLITTVPVQKRDEKEKEYGGIIEIIDFCMLERLDAKRGGKGNILRQIKETEFDPTTDYKRAYFEIVNPPTKEIIRRYRSN
jgi:hypothetical protein